MARTGRNAGSYEEGTPKVLPKSKPKNPDMARAISDAKRVARVVGKSMAFPMNVITEGGLGAGILKSYKDLRDEVPKMNKGGKVMGYEHGGDVRGMGKACTAKPRKVKVR